MKLSNKTYDILKWIAQIAIPAFEIFWLTIGKIWGIPLTVEIGATIAAVGVLLGALLGISNINYKKASIGVQETFNEDSIYEMVNNDEN